jgi:hypothetical protein
LAKRGGRLISLVSIYLPPFLPVLPLQQCRCWISRDDTNQIASPRCYNYQYPNSRSNTQLNEPVFVFISIGASGRLAQCLSHPRPLHE